SCERLASDDPPQDLWLDLRWRGDAQEGGLSAQIVVTVQNEIGALSDVAGVIARYGVSIANIRLSNRSQGFVEMAIDVEVKDVRQLNNLLAGLRVSKSVVSAERKDAEHP
ncbi:MAG: ACT domain-containing protein, partial [Parvularculaceae bacterium]|nr:ACT domain-containing protein [Parvularculaceae bacterium]